MCVLKSQTLKTLIYHGRAALATPIALGESSRRYEGRADCEAHHLQPLGGQPGGNPVRQRAQACGERGHRRGFARPRVQHQPQSPGRSRQQLSGPKRVPGPGRQVHCQVCRHHGAGHGWVRHLQDLRGPLPPITRAGQHAFGGHPEFGSVQDSLWLWRQDDNHCG